VFRHHGQGGSVSPTGIFDTAHRSRWPIKPRTLTACTERPCFAFSMSSATDTALRIEKRCRRWLRLASSIPAGQVGKTAKSQS